MSDQSKKPPVKKPTRKKRQPSQSQPTPLSRKYFKLTDEELAKVRRRKETQEEQEVDIETYVIAEFGYYFGWQGIKDVFINNEMSLADAQKLILAARKVWYSQVHDNAQATFIASAAPHAKRPGNVFRKGMKFFIDKMKVKQ